MTETRCAREKKKWSGRQPFGTFGNITITTTTTTRNSTVFLTDVPRSSPPLCTSTPSQLPLCSTFLPHPDLSPAPLLFAPICFATSDPPPRTNSCDIRGRLGLASRARPSARSSKHGHLTSPDPFAFLLTVESGTCSTVSASCIRTCVLLTVSSTPQKTPFQRVASYQRPSRFWSKQAALPHSSAHILNPHTNIIIS